MTLSSTQPRRPFKSRHTGSFPL